MNALLLWFVAAIALPSASALTVATYDLTFVDYLRCHTKYCSATGDEYKLNFSYRVRVTAAVPSGGPYPLVLLLHPQGESHLTLARTLAALGLVVVAVEQQHDTISDFQKDALFVLVETIVEAALVSSPLHGKINNHLGLIGIGNGVAATTAFANMGADHPEYAVPGTLSIDFWVMVSPDLSQGDVAAVPSTIGPLLVVAHSADCVTPAEANAVPLYGHNRHTCKTYLELVGGNVAYLSDNAPGSSWTAEDNCGARPAAQISAQQSVERTLIVSWIDAIVHSSLVQWGVFRSGISAAVAGGSLSFYQDCTAFGSLYTH